MRAAVLAGGLGTRLRPLTFFVPKPLVHVAGRPLIDHILAWLKANGVREIAVIGHYMQDLLAGYLAEFFPDVVFIKSPRLLGTAGQLYYAKEWATGGDLVVVNADVLTNLDLKMPAELHKAKKAQLTIVATPQTASLRFGVLEIEGDMLKAWREKPTFSYITSTGVYIASSQVVERLREEFLDMDSLARSLIPNVAVYVAREAFFHDVGTLGDLPKAQSVKELRP